MATRGHCVCEHMACCVSVVPCAFSCLLSVPSHYQIIVSVAPLVSPSLPSFVSLFSLLSVVLCWSVVFLRVCVMLTTAVLYLPACFSFSGWFLLLCFFVFQICIFLLLKIHSPALESSPHLSLQSVHDKIHFSLTVLSQHHSTVD